MKRKSFNQASTSKKIAYFSLVFLAAATIAFLILRTTGAMESQTESNSTEPAISEPTSQNNSNKTVQNPDAPVSSEAKSEGRYAGYIQSSLADPGYDTNIVFFFAPWCPECRAFKEAITSFDIPAGVQFLETDFDSSTDLKKQYGVTLQSTFVRVDDGGSLQKKWVGYGKEKSTETILNNVQ